jgi:hypothetical protein
VRRSIKAGEETSVEAPGTRISEDEEKEKTTTKREDEDVVSSAPSSPLCEPCLPDDDLDPPPELIKAWELAQRNYDIKKGNFFLTGSPPLYCKPSRFLRILEIYRSTFFILQTAIRT